MSYILEALKKLEQKRQQEDAPNLLTLQGETASVRKKRTLWPYVVSGIVILNIAIIIIFLWIGPWRKTFHSPPTQTQVAREIAPPPLTKALPEKKSGPIVEPKTVISQPEKKEVVLPAPKQTPEPSSGKAVSEPPPSRTAPVQASPLSKTPNEPYLTQTQPVKPSKRIVTIKELPADIKSKLSELRMTVHSYNDQPQSRFAVINNTTVREGQPVNNEMKLEQVTRNGVVLNYQGHRFSLGINETP